ncbi:MAG TPA: hypothetical protein VF173_23075 [Thermoanaerobaculia bacterium]|nr:hypothetical protein [Thermoanaerobaculia bacterium]
MSRFKLMLMAVAILMTAVATQPAKSTPCILYSACRLCADGATQQPCYVTRCPATAPPHYFNCGDCVTNCVPYDI